MPNWKCERCGKIHRNNPTTCANCDYAVLKQTDESALGTFKKALLALVFAVSITLLALYIL